MIDSLYNAYCHAAFSRCSMNFYRSLQIRRDALRLSHVLMVSRDSVWNVSDHTKPTKCSRILKSSQAQLISDHIIPLEFCQILPSLRSSEIILLHHKTLQVLSDSSQSSQILFSEPLMRSGLP